MHRTSSLQRQRRALFRPLADADELHQWLRVFCNIDVPRRAVCPHHRAPFDYVQRAYFEPSSDQIVHAPRGGGKTRLAAVATLLDLLHKPEIAIRILGGSLDQSLRMWEHLLPDLERLVPDLLDGSPRTRSHRIRLATGGTCAVLTQSQRAVRGLRVQKLRCDEIELFKPDIWEAAQLVTRSRTDSMVGRDVLGAIDALSTLHEPAGLMQRILDGAERNGAPHVVRWCLLDVLEKCPAERACNTCPLWEDCKGVAKTACAGFVRIDDAIAMKRRVSLDTWQTEMLCQRPAVRGAVFPRFDRSTHVVEQPAITGWNGVDGRWSLSVDFGFAAPFVCLWVQEQLGVTFVVDEYVQPQRTLDEHLLELAARPWPRPSHISCDPAGAGRNEQTATSSVQVLRRAGYIVKHRPSRIVEGVETLRAALGPASGAPTLFVHPRCRHLIRALQSYRYATTAAGASELPLKDGEHDHLVDALRYHFVNAQAQPLTSRRY
ncbi:MAG: hypothetical protein QM770_03755 [Tepidisphaeraceae bacterium]